MDELAPPPARRSGVLRHWLCRLAVLPGLVFAVEVGSWLAWWAVEGQPFSYGRAWGERRRLAGRDAKAPSRIYPFVLPFPLLADVHPYLGFSYSPEARGAMLRGEAPATDWGFTDKANRSPVRKRGPDRVVVGVLGASVASLFSGQGAEALARELKQSPRFAGKKVEVVSLAIGASKQPQQLMALNYALALGAEFDVVINLDGLNEVAWYKHDNAANGVNHLYPLAWHHLVSQLPDDGWTDLGKAVHLRQERLRWAQHFGAAPLRLSVTANLLWKLRDRQLAGDIAETDRALRARKEAGLPHRAHGPRNAFRNDEEMLAQLVANWERCSLLIHQLCKARGIAYYHFLQPNQYVPGSKTLTPQERRDAYTDHAARPWIEKGWPRMREAGRRLAAQGVEFVDLSMAYAQSGETLYYDNCCHINKAGAEALAGPIARAILQTKEPPRASR
jgi:hypothetical protein